MRRFWAGTALMLFSLFVNQIANVLELRYGTVGAIAAAIIAYGLLITSGPIARAWSWASAGDWRRRLSVAMIAATVTGILGFVVAWVLIAVNAKQTAKEVGAGTPIIQAAQLQQQRARVKSQALLLSAELGRFLDERGAGEPPLPERPALPPPPDAPQKEHQAFQEAMRTAQNAYNLKRATYDRETSALYFQLYAARVLTVMQELEGIGLTDQVMGSDYRGIMHTRFAGEGIVGDLTIRMRALADTIDAGPASPAATPRIAVLTPQTKQAYILPDGGLTLYQPIGANADSYALVANFKNEPPGRSVRRLVGSVAVANPHPTQPVTGYWLNSSDWRINFECGGSEQSLVLAYIVRHESAQLLKDDRDGIAAKIQHITFWTLGVDNQPRNVIVRLSEDDKLLLEVEYRLNLAANPPSVQLVGSRLPR